MPKKTLDPLPSAAFQILLALLDGDLHGYGIMRVVEEQTDGSVRLGPGTLYSSLQTLEDAQAIREVPNKAANAERRRHYRLTAAGKKLVQSEVQRLEELLKIARTKKLMEGKYA
jgi:DNA-binding PadR family transcriptional regulator